MIAPSKRLNRKLFRDIKQRRIVSLTHSPSPGFPFIPAFKYNKGNYYALDMKDYPSSIQGISLNLAKSVIALDDHVEKLLSMNKFPVLTRLELLFCLELNMASMILKTLPNPQILTSLGLYLRNRFPEYDEQAIIPIFQFIRNNCPGLDKLDLRITHSTEKLGLLNFQNKLRVLNLWIPVKTEKHLKDLGRFILAAKNLESLDLTIDFDANCDLSKENLDEFYKVIGQLSQLKKLYLNFSPADNHFTRKDYLQYHEASASHPVLKEAIAYLSRLEELSLRIPNLGNHLLCEALTRIASQLKSLEVNFYGQALDMNGSLSFIGIFRKMMKLRELCVSKFSLEHEENFLSFKEGLKGLKHLEEIELDHFEIPSKGDEILCDLVLSLLKKKGLKELRVKHNFQENVREGRTLVQVDEILKKNPELRIAKIQSRNISFSDYFPPFESFKYV